MTKFKELRGCEERPHIRTRDLEDGGEALQLGTCFVEALQTRAWEGVLCSEGLTFKWDGDGNPPPPGSF